MGGYQTKASVQAEHRLEFGNRLVCCTAPIRRDDGMASAREVADFLAEFFGRTPFLVHIISCGHETYFATFEGAPVLERFRRVIDNQFKGDWQPSSPTDDRPFHFGCLDHACPNPGAHAPAPFREADLWFVRQLLVIKFDKNMVTLERPGGDV
jgi:hypothetical protein